MAAQDMEVHAEMEPGSLRRLIQASRTWDTVSRREMRKNLRVAAEHGASDARSTVRGLPSKSQTGLRAQLAEGVKVKISSGRESKSSGAVSGEGVRVVASAAGLPENKKPMVAASMSKSWRHPVFGRSDWVFQSGNDWFFQPLRGHVEEYRAAIVMAINEASKAI